MITLRSSFESCMTEMLKLSPDFKVWASATDAVAQNASKKTRIRMLLLPETATADKGGKNLV